jgi:transposase-like protein
MKKRVRRGDPQRQQQWQAAVRRWQESGASVRAFCRAEGLRESAFYFWRRKLARRGRANPEGPHERVNGAWPRPCSATAVSPLPRSGGRLVPGPAPSFLPVRVVAPRSVCVGPADAGQPVAGGEVEIILEEGRRAVRVRAGFDRQTLADVLAVLEARPC